MPSGVWCCACVALLLAGCSRQSDEPQATGVSPEMERLSEELHQDPPAEPADVKAAPSPQPPVAPLRPATAGAVLTPVKGAEPSAPIPQLRPQTAGSAPTPAKGPDGSEPIAPLHPATPAGPTDSAREAALAAAAAALRAADAGVAVEAAPESAQAASASDERPSPDGTAATGSGDVSATGQAASASVAGVSSSSAAGSGDLFIAACLGGLTGNGTAVLVAVASDHGLVPVDLIDPGLAKKVAGLAWYRPESPAAVHFDQPQRVAQSRQVEPESAESVSYSKLALGPCHAQSGSLFVLATRPLAPAVWDPPTTRTAEIPEDARSESGPEALGLPFRRAPEEAPAPPEIDLTVRHLAGSKVYELRGDGPANCWSLELSADADPTCTPKDPSESQESVDSREEGWARLVGTDHWLGIRHVYTSGPEGGQEKLEAIDLTAEGKVSGSELVLSSSND